MTDRARDAVVVGAGPNGLAAAIVLARAGRSVAVLEAEPTVGGGTRSAELTEPGFVHDVCSAIHPLVLGSPFFRTLDLAALGVETIQPPAPLAHPLDDGSAVLLERSVDATAEGLGADADAYRRLMGPLTAEAERLLPQLLGPLRPPRHPLALARFGFHALRSAGGFATSTFRGERARALFGGMSAHSMLSLTAPAGASFGLVLGLLGHTVGWPLIRGGSQGIGDGLAAHLRSLGGEVLTSTPIASFGDLPSSRAVLLDLTPRQVLRLGGSELPASYRRTLGRYRYGPGVFKVDWALEGEIPWRARECRRAATVHLGGGLPELVLSEAASAKGDCPERPFVIVAQQSLFDDTRAPAGRHTAWAYCHVPNGSTADMTDAIEAQIERVAPGFGELVLARRVSSPADLEARNANLVGGDIAGGANDLGQLIARPALRAVPYSTPLDGVYLCSASTPPGGGVHGMCGFLAARAALRASA
jgi:phytoene dehydrogenase-like protein